MGLSLRISIASGQMSVRSDLLDRIVLGFRFSALARRCSETPASSAFMIIRFAWIGARRLTFVL
jgi:hypothetical protein